jgi:hypothetical protein
MSVIPGRYVDRRLIQRMGRRVEWHRAMKCPNLRSDGQHDYSCSACGGRGYIYDAPKLIRALMHADSREESYDVSGAWEKGSCTATIDARHLAGDQDKFVCLDLPMRDTLTMVRSEGSNFDRIRQARVSELLAASDVSTSYTTDNDCRLYADLDGTQYIEWIKGSRSPSAGQRYSVMWSILPVWIVIGHPMVRGFGGSVRRQLPYKVELKREDVAVRGGRT